MTAIHIERAHKSFGNVHALRDVTLQVPNGSIFGFLGPNGAGKTTTLRGLIGMMRFDGGTVTVLGADPWRDRTALHARIGYLPGGMGMYARMTGQQMLDYVAALGARGFRARRDTPLRSRVIEAVQISSTDLARPVRDYSKGMRQKLAIVQALQHDPELAMMDEPSEGLDPLVQHDVYELLRERGARGATTIFSSHTLSEVEALCDEVAIIRDGTVVVQSTLDALRAARPRSVRIGASDEALAALPTSFERVGTDHAGRTTFHVGTSASNIVAALAGIELNDLVIDEPSLDDIFRSYYTAGGN